MSRMLRVGQAIPPPPGPGAYHMFHSRPIVKQLASSRGRGHKLAPIQPHYRMVDGIKLYITPYVPKTGNSYFINMLTLIKLN